MINHKRRGPRLQKQLPLPLEDKNAPDSNNDSKNVVVKDENLRTEAPTASFEENRLGNRTARDGHELKLNSDGTEGYGDVLKLNSGEAERNGDVFKLNPNETEKGGEADDFFEFLDSMSSISNTEVDDNYAIDPLRMPGTPTEEFYSAYDELSSDGSSSSPFRKNEDDIHEMRLSLLMEIDKRKQAEEALENFDRKWQNLRQHLLTVGLVLPNLPRSLEEEVNVDPIEDLGQQIVVAREIAASVARGCARAEAEMEIEPQIAAKNFEISRLLDRLHYYETANKEMSQRNQEAVEKARQKRRRRNKRQKWFWGSIGLVVTLSSAAIAWSYLPSSMFPSHEDCKNDH